MRSKKDIGIKSVAAAKSSSDKGYSSSSSCPWFACGVELDVGSLSDVATFFSTPLCSIRRHCSSSEICKLGVFWLWFLSVWRFLAMMSYVRRYERDVKVVAPPTRKSGWLSYTRAVVSGLGPESLANANDH